ncbi:peptidase inhibitor family I36 protein [Streptomyces sp. NPDC091268]|uniref:peptidase inhibitor family I36 protein n=1 Tax=Streptomyces sp. NPDC091268 TaxID=3365979 RepID=UPI00381FF2EF
MNTLKSSLGRLPLVGLAVIMLAASLMWLQAGSARAAYGTCPANSFCLYTQAGGEGETVSFSPADAPVLDYNGSGNPVLNGKTFVSFRNNTTEWACLYDSANYGGTEMQSVRPGHLGGDLPKYESGPQKGTQVVVPASHKFAKSKSGCRTGFERCRATHVCIFQGPSGRGVAGVTNQTDVLPDGVQGNKAYSTTWDNKLVSVANRSDKFACFYEKPGYAVGTWQVGGKAMKAFVVRPGQETTLPSDYQGSISSHKLADTESKC